MDEFDKFLSDSRKKEPSDFQMKKWKKAVAQANNRTIIPKAPTGRAYWGQMVAAVLVGVVIGGLLFGNLEQTKSPEVPESSYEDATIEVIYTKL